MKPMSLILVKVVYKIQIPLMIPTKVVQDKVFNVNSLKQYTQIKKQTNNGWRVHGERE